MVEAKWFEVIDVDSDDASSVIVLVVGDGDAGITRAIDEAIEADAVPYDGYNGIWHIGPDQEGRNGISFHLIQADRNDDDRLERLWAIYEPPSYLVEAICDVPHYVAVIPESLAGPRDQPTLALRGRMIEALVVAVDHQSHTVKLHLRGQ